eukprot:jgi/Tetstr1/453271/TSEL_003953.t1
MRWLPVRKLASLAGRSQFLFLAIKPARFYLRELHDVLRTKDSWSGRVKMTHQLPHDLEFSGYGWGAVLNETTEARGFWYDGDRELHTIFKELKAIRYAMLTFLSSCEVDMY